MRGLIRISYGAGGVEGGEGDWSKKKNQQRWEQRRDRVRAEVIDGKERKSREGGEGGGEQCDADLLKHQGPGSAMLNFSSYS